MRFTTWLKRQRGRNDPVGDLSLDLRRDKTWPKNATKFIDFTKHLCGKRASDTCVKAFLSAWREYGGKLPNCQLEKQDECDAWNCWADDNCDLALMIHGYEPEKKPKDAKPPSRPLALRFIIMQRDGFKCRLCGQGADEGRKLEVDHKHPASKGGTIGLDNLWTLCFECNRGKGARLLQ